MLHERYCVHAGGSIQESQPLSEPLYSSCSYAYDLQTMFDLVGGPEQSL